jgi:hypothetical protein
VLDAGPPFEMLHARATFSAHAAQHTSCQYARRGLVRAGAGRANPGGQGSVRRRDVPALEAREEEAPQVGACARAGRAQSHFRRVRHFVHT